MLLIHPPFNFLSIRSYNPSVERCSILRNFRHSVPLHRNSSFTFLLYSSRSSSKAKTVYPSLSGYALLFFNNNVSLHFIDLLPLLSISPSLGLWPTISRRPFLYLLLQLFFREFFCCYIPPFICLSFNVFLLFMSHFLCSSVSRHVVRPLIHLFFPHPDEQSTISNFNKKTHLFITWLRYWILHRHKFSQW